MPVPDYRTDSGYDGAFLWYGQISISSEELESKFFWVLKTTSSSCNCTLEKCVPGLVVSN